MAGFNIPPAWQLPTGVNWPTAPGFDSVGSMTSYPQAPSSMGISNPAAFGKSAMKIEYNASGIMQFKSNDQTVWPMSIAMPRGSAYAQIISGKDQLTFARRPDAAGPGSSIAQSHLVNNHDPMEAYGVSSLNALLYSADGRQTWGMEEDWMVVGNTYHYVGVQQHSVPSQRQDQTEYRGNYHVKERCRTPFIWAALGKRPHKLDSCWLLARRYKYEPFATKILEELKMQVGSHPLDSNQLTTQERKYLTDQKRSVESAERELRTAFQEKGTLMEIDPTFRNPIDRAYLDADTGRMTGLRASGVDAKTEYYWRLDPWMGTQHQAPPSELYLPSDRSFIGHAYRIGYITQLFNNIDDVQGNKRLAQKALYPQTLTGAYKEALTKLPQVEMQLRTV